MRAPTDEAGNVYGKITVLDKHKSGRELGRAGGRHWLCRCECGHEYWVNGGSLRRGYVTQCRACAEKQRGRPHVLIDGIEHRGCTKCHQLRPLEYYGKYKSGRRKGKYFSYCTFCEGYKSAKVNHVMELTLEEYIAIRCQPCVLTGIVNPVFMAVDRIDSSKEYTKDNVQPMLSPFNYEKRNQDDAEFKAKIAPITDPIRDMMMRGSYL